jgi:mitofusin
MAGTEEATGPLRGAQQAFVEQKVRLLGGLGSTKQLLTDIRFFNKESWTIRYPKLSTKAEEVEPSPKRRGVRRSLSFMDDPSSETDVILGRGIRRSLTLAAISDAQENDGDDSPSDPDAGGRLIPESEVPDFQVVRLDLNMGHPGSSAAAGALVSQLEKVSIANLVDERMAACLQHIDRLCVRVEDTSSKVLVTGDLNAGKSTFVNTLLRRTVMPVDQQPCTTAFCEVHDFSENNNVEEVHIIKDASAYSIGDESTYKRADLGDLDRIMDDEERPSILKLYLNDSRPLNQSLLNNGIVDISLIDAPGLNRDSVKTTALFARQEEIDVVVFVVSAENHLTESARNFLKNASNEKAYVFIVVNKFDQIKNKDKCRRMVLEQIKELSPRTYEDANDLVHFVDSLAGKDDPSFEELEASLRSFVLVKRAKSKLNPASTYLSNLLSDIELLVGANAIVAQAEIAHAKGDLDAVRPVLERMKNSREALEEALEAVEEQGASSASSKTHRMLTDALDRVGQGLPGVSLVQMPSYPGLLNLWDYARDVRKALITSLDMAVKLAEDEARVVASTGVQEVLILGDEYLPEGVERSRRVFMPEAMFSTRRTRDGKRKVRRNSAVVAGGTLGLGIGLATREEMLQPTFLDLLDAPHHIWIYLCDGKEAEVEEKGTSALGIVSVAVATVTMVGGQSIGMRGFVEGVMHITNVLADENARKWGAPILGALVAGAAAYFILELPSSVPRTVGRRIRHSLVDPAGGAQPQEELFVYAHAARVSRETRKVLRLASWDLKERFRVALEERSREVRGAEETERRAVCAKDWFAVVAQKAAEIRDQAGLVSLL